VHCEIIYDLTKILISWGFRLNWSYCRRKINVLQMNSYISNAQRVWPVVTKCLTCFFQNIKQRLARSVSRMARVGTEGPDSPNSISGRVADISFLDFDQTCPSGWHVFCGR
jgi:hypothetical protein